MTHIPKGFEEIAGTMQHAHQEILTRLHDYGYTIEAYPRFDAPGNPKGVAAAKAHPMQGILKYHGLADWEWRTAFLPSISVVDLVVHPRDNDLVIATHARGFYILDDITPLQQLASGKVSTSAPNVSRVFFCGCVGMVFA